MNRNFKLALISGSVALGVMGCAGQQSAMKSTPSFVLTTPVVELRPGGKVAMYGTGFAPKQEVMLLLKDAGGGMSSIGGVLKPVPVPNQDGAWAAEWDISSYVRVIRPGTGMLTVADKDFKTLGQAPIVFVAAPAKPAPQAAAKGAPKAVPGARPAAATATKR
ncbi:MAG: hypothetical protein IT514_02050 [Burkholderiales bacterium]|nr:hypothetical protein [Burkholderiales bacterium]